jgi:hypothetical protein
MGKLPPGIAFEYKNENGFTYASPKGSGDWSLIGRTITIDDHRIQNSFEKIKTYIFSDPKKYKTRAEDVIVCLKIIEMSETNSSLHEALERIKSIFYMTVKNDT